MFGVTKSSGEFDGDYVWRYVPNERIAFLKLEKVILVGNSLGGHVAGNSQEINHLKKGG